MSKEDPDIPARIRVALKVVTTLGPHLGYGVGSEDWRPQGTPPESTTKTYEAAVGVLRGYLEEP